MCSWRLSVCCAEAAGLQYAVVAGEPRVFLVCGVLLFSRSISSDIPTKIPGDSGEALQPAHAPHTRAPTRRSTRREPGQTGLYGDDNPVHNGSSQWLVGVWASNKPSNPSRAAVCTLAPGNAVWGRHTHQHTPARLLACPSVFLPTKSQEGCQTVASQHAPPPHTLAESVLHARCVAPAACL